MIRFAVLCGCALALVHGPKQASAQPYWGDGPPAWWDEAGYDLSGIEPASPIDPGGLHAQQQEDAYAQAQQEALDLGSPWDAGLEAFFEYFNDNYGEGLDEAIGHTAVGMYEDPLGTSSQMVDDAALNIPTEFATHCELEENIGDAVCATVEENVDEYVEAFEENPCLVAGETILVLVGAGAACNRSIPGRPRPHRPRPDGDSSDHGGSSGSQSHGEPIGHGGSNVVYSDGDGGVIKVSNETYTPEQAQQHIDFETNIQNQLEQDGFPVHPTEYSYDQNTGHLHQHQPEVEPYDPAVHGDAYRDELYELQEQIYEYDMEHGIGLDPNSGNFGIDQDGNLVWIDT